MDQRREFYQRLQRGESMTELCREYKISRKTGYKVVTRVEQFGELGLYDQKRAPEHIPHKTPPETVALFVELKHKHPTWGPKKLRDVLSKQHPGVRMPAVSTAGELLRREGLVTPRRRSRGDDTPYSPLSHAENPNDVWCIDYKGQWQLRDGTMCYPLTLTDAASRYILACEAFSRIDGRDVHAVMSTVFRKYGLPTAIRFDGGAPFATTGLRRLSKLSAWWMLQGIRLEQTEPASPQQNGRHERMHRTLKDETVRPTATSLLQQQERFDAFMDVFNKQRPHEALEMRRPAQVYASSTHSYNEAVQVAYPMHDLAVRVRKSGHIYIPGTGKRAGNFFVSSALSGQLVGLRELDDEIWLVSFLDLDLGVIDLRSRKLIPYTSTPSPEQPTELLPMCPV